MHRSCSQLRPETGFTLFELVLVVMISSIIAGMLNSFIRRPMEAYRDMERRATLVDVAETALRRMARDVRASLPNSLRVSGDKRSLEILHLADGARYREDPGTNPTTSEDHTNPNDWLSFSGDTQFNILGRLSHLDPNYGQALTAGTRLAIYNTSTNVYTDAATSANPGVITPAATTITVTDDVDEDKLTLSSSFEFLLRSPRQKVYVIDSPVSYICDLTGETITRYGSYNINATQPTDPGVAPLSTAASALVTNRVAACEFLYDPGTPSRAGLLTIALTLSEAGEQIRLFQQVHVNNTP
ncbi:MAG: prepilin-type N-terminal cleavage/methylation domain-containing protein [Deltaproteobacteria bacterium]|nr:MAG: prepilin-type N-terminal cleavage/methylation domain-containing protein [Deltaproteobacteria bacterium]